MRRTSSVDWTGAASSVDLGDSSKYSREAFCKRSVETSLETEVGQGST